MHVTNSGQTNWFEFAKAALELFGVDHPVAAITAADWQRLRPNTAARPSYSVRWYARNVQVAKAEAAAVAPTSSSKSMPMPPQFRS